MCPAVELGLGWAPSELRGLRVQEGRFSRGNIGDLFPDGNSVREAGRNNR